MTTPAELADLLRSHAERLVDVDLSVAERVAIAEAAARLIGAVGAEEPSLGPGTDTGDGHVWPRPDGLLRRCGGPALCRRCKADNILWGS